MERHPSNLNSDRHCAIFELSLFRYTYFAWHDLDRISRISTSSRLLLCESLLGLFGRRLDGGGILQPASNPDLGPDSGRTSCSPSSATTSPGFPGGCGRTGSSVSGSPELL